MQSGSSPRGAESKKAKKKQPSGMKGVIFKDSYEAWLDAQVAKRSKGSPSNQSGPTRSSVMPASTFSSWLSKQSVSVKEDKPPQRGAVSTYERWLQKRVEERRSVREEEPEETPGTEGEPVSTVTVEDEDMVAAST